MARPHGASVGHTVFVNVAFIRLGWRNTRWALVCDVSGPLLSLFHYYTSVLYVSFCRNALPWPLCLFLRNFRFCVIACVHNVCQIRMRRIYFWVFCQWNLLPLAPTRTCSQPTAHASRGVVRMLNGPTFIIIVRSLARNAQCTRAERYCVMRACARVPNDETANMGQIKKITWMVRLALRRTAKRQCDATSIRFCLRLVGPVRRACVQHSPSSPTAYVGEFFGSFIYLSIICSEARKLAISVPWYMHPWSMDHTVDRN